MQRFYRHASGAIGLPMQFGVFLPPQALHGGHKVPVLFYLAGLTCNEETFAIKAGRSSMRRAWAWPSSRPTPARAAPRCRGQADSWDFGLGAGFYLDATQRPLVSCGPGRWKPTSPKSCTRWLGQHLPVDLNRAGISATRWAATAP